MQVRDILEQIYGDKLAAQHWPAFAQLIARAAANQKPALPALSHQDAVLITYASQFTGEEKSLGAFARFADNYLADSFPVIHFLPLYPYSSDDGFSVIDYMQVDPQLGGWQEVAALARRRQLMLDFVCNHISAQSEWAQRYIAGDQDYDDFFIEADPNGDFSGVTRPRTSPLLTPFDTSTGKKWLWTTFGGDQLDLNYANPRVLYRMLEVLLFYVQQGASWVRLDAVGFLWKQPGTSCIHLEKTHAVIRFFRAVLDQVAPGTRLVTETNVPQRENLSYFGNGRNESNLVYQFPLPMLVLYSFFCGSAELLTGWAEALPPPPSGDTSYFNFLASHDGVGVNPVRDIIPPGELSRLLQHLCENAGALVSYKATPGGGNEPYEVNVSYLSALRAGEGIGTGIRRFLCAHALLMSLQGVPAVYIHSLLGSENDTRGALQSGINRRINRERFAYGDIAAQLETPGTTRQQIFHALRELLATRAGCTAFHPAASQKILRLDGRVFALERRAADGTTAVCLHNISGSDVQLENPLGGMARDLLSGGKAGRSLMLPPYGFLWLGISQ